MVIIRGFGPVLRNHYYNYKAWKVKFSYGNASSDSWGYNDHVRLVRGGQSFDTFVDNADSTVTQSNTGLMWAKCSEGQSGTNCTGAAKKMNWSAALTAANNSNLGGYNDWRLPNSKELQALVDYGRYSPAIDTDHFPNTPSWFFWSGSPVAGSSYAAWNVYFVNGDAYYYNRDVNYPHVRLVRGGQSFDSLSIRRSQTARSDLGDVSIPVSAAPVSGTALPASLRDRLDAFGASRHETSASADGEQFVFATDAALLPEDINDHRDLYHYGATADRLTLLTHAPDGAASNAASHSPRFDVIGNRVLFLSHATNLVTGEQNAAQQLYQVDLDSGLIRRLSETVDGEPANGDISQLELAAEVGKVVFRSKASNLDGGLGLYLHDLETGRREVLVSSTGLPLTDSQAERPAIDASASLLAYDRPDRAGQSQIQTLELATRAERQETPLDTATVSACCARISNDGRYLAWRETDAAGVVKLRLRDDATGKDALIDWPEMVAPDAATVRLEFRDGGRELWWIPLDQEADDVEALYKAPNPVFVAPASLH